MMGHVLVSLVCLFVVSVSLPVNEEQALQDIFRAAQIPLATGDPCEIGVVHLVRFVLFPRLHPWGMALPG